MKATELVINNTIPSVQGYTELPASPLDFQSLLELMQQRINIEAEEYNNLLDELENSTAQLSNSQLRVSLQAAELEELRAKVESLTSGNKLLMTELKEAESKRRSGGTQLEKLARSEMLLKERLVKVEADLKALKAHGDPLKIIGQNKTLREKNSELDATNKRIQAQSTKLMNELKDMAKYGGDYYYLPSFSTAEGENLYIHPKKIKTVEDGEILTQVALTYWHGSGVGRVVTWNGEKTKFASFGHKNVDEKLKPSDEVLAFAKQWFEKHVVVQGRVQTMASDFRIKEGKR